MVSSIKRQGGFSLLEILVSISLLLLVLIGGLSANSLASNAVSTTKSRAGANLLAKEAMEALHSVRADNFNSLMAGDFHPLMQSGVWTLVAGSETIGVYTRTITLSTIMRDLICSTPICNISTAGGRIDPLSFKAIVKVAWSENGIGRTYQFDTLVSYWR